MGSPILKGYGLMYLQPGQRARTGIGERQHFDRLSGPAGKDELPHRHLKNAGRNARHVEKRVRKGGENEDCWSPVSLHPSHNAPVSLRVFHQTLAAETGQVADQLADRSARSGRQRHQKRVEHTAQREDHRNAWGWQEHGRVCQHGDDEDARVAVDRKLFGPIAYAVNEDYDGMTAQQAHYPQKDDALTGGHAALFFVDAHAVDFHARPCGSLAT
jgi:hypothetical protein